MLVVSKQRYLPTTVNTLVLTKDDNYFYVHRDVYDRCVVLSDRHKLDTLWSVLEAQNNSDTVEWFYENAPTPVNILAPFLGLIEEGISADMEICCGALHVITGVIDVRSFIQQPQQLRKSVSFSLSIKEEYEMSWERFFLTAVDYDQRNQIVPYLIAGQAIAGGYAPIGMTGFQQATPTQQGWGSEEQQESGEYDDGPEKYGPGWTRTGQGVYFNTETSETIFEEDEDEDAKFLEELLGGSEEPVPEMSASEEPIQSTEAEKAQTRKLLSLDVD